MAVHAELGRRDPREGGFLDGRVTIAAIDADALNMMLVAEGNGLVLGDVDLGDEVNAIAVEEEPHQSDEEDEACKDAGFKSPIGAARKYLSHPNVQLNIERKGTGV